MRHMYKKLNDSLQRSLKREIRVVMLLLLPVLLLGCADLMRNDSSKASTQEIPMGVLADIQHDIAAAERLAAQGDVRAQVELGKIYWLARYYKESIGWYAKAAEQGNAQAQYRLGQAYRLGEGVERNMETARAWYQKAAEQGYANAKHMLESLDREGSAGGMLSSTGGSVNWLASPEVQEPQKKINQPSPIKESSTARKSSGKKAKKTAAPLAPGKSNLTEKGVVEKEPVDPNLSALQSAAEDGDAQSQLELSLLYLQGDKVKKNPQLAVKWGEKAALQGNSVAQNNMGAAYSHGDGVEKDLAKAFEWYEKAARQGYPLAQYNLAASYAMGAGTEKDYLQAYAWFQVLSQSDEGETLLDEKSRAVIKTLENELSREGKLEQAQLLGNEYVAKFLHQKNNT